MEETQRLSAILTPWYGGIVSGKEGLNKSQTTPDTVVNNHPPLFVRCEMIQVHVDISDIMDWPWLVVAGRGYFPTHSLELGYDIRILV